MAISADEKDILKLSIDELRRVYDRICIHYDQLRLRALSMIGAEGAIVAFIIASGSGLGIPTANDRRVFFWGAIALLGIAFALFAWIISAVQWRLPHDLETTPELIKRHREYETYLTYMHDDMVDSININRGPVEAKANRFNIAVYLLVTGAIILLVLKYGGQTACQKSH